MSKNILEAKGLELSEEEIETLRLNPLKIENQKDYEVKAEILGILRKHKISYRGLGKLFKETEELFLTFARL